MYFLRSALVNFLIKCLTVNALVIDRVFFLIKKNVHYKLY